MPTARRKPDEEYELFASEFEKQREIPYRPRTADFVQLADLRKVFHLNGCWLPAIRNYLASPLSKYTLADLCVRFDVFRLSSLDRYGKPVTINRDTIGAEPEVEVDQDALSESVKSYMKREGLV